MRRTILSLSLTVVFVVTGLAQETNRRTALDSLVAAERAFCKAAAEHGMRDAFLANLADDSTLFRPRAVNGKQWTSASPAQPGLLSWFPIYADVSSAGDLGYTTGPYEYRQSPDTNKVYYGYFMTIWKRQADGQWKAVLDQGVGGPLSTAKAADLQFGPPGHANQGDVAAWRDSLWKVDREFLAASEKQGAVTAYANYTADDLRLYRDGKAPFVGKAAARAAYSVEGVLTWQPAKSDVSLSGDLGYTYGMAQWKKPNADAMEYFNYVRLWKRQSNGEWRVVLEVFDPCPPIQ